MDMIRRSGVPHSAAIIDVGSGATRLLDALLDEGFEEVTALDIASSAFSAVQLRLGERAKDIDWVVADIRTVELSDRAYDLWHDRAVFHFLTDPRDRDAYLSRLKAALKPGGQLVIATFADDGPAQCSGLDVMRYSPEALTVAVGGRFELLESVRHTHRTPWGSEQRFVHARYRLIGG
jgi:SAM-dependent methyltransferase